MTFKVQNGASLQSVILSLVPVKVNNERLGTCYASCDEHGTGYNEK